MPSMRLAALLVALALPASAQTDHAALAERALDKVILPAAERLAETTEALAAAAPASCPTDPDALRMRYQAAFDAWMGLQHLSFGPLEEDNRAFQLAFWPDSRGTTGRTVERFLVTENPAIDDAAAFAQVSVAGRGFYALERLLYGDDGPLPIEGFACRYVAAVAADLVRVSGEVVARWRDPWGPRVREAGAPGNETYLAHEEVTQRLFATLLGSLELSASQRLAKPMGSLTSPRPRLAEAWRSGRSLRQIALVLDGAQIMLDDVFAPSLLPSDRAGIEDALTRARTALANVEEIGTLGEAVAQSRIRVEALKQAVEGVGIALQIHLGPGLGVAQGFNSADGD
ncbi:MAG: imelysin family protein [Pseudomonadota bacterium]